MLAELIWEERDKEHVIIGEPLLAVEECAKKFPEACKSQGG